LQYSYGSFGIPDARPRLESLGPEESILRNIRITGGTLRPYKDFNSIYFNFANVENIEIDHVRVDGIGGGIATGHNLSNFHFHRNVIQGRGLAEGHGVDIASVVESIVENNVFNIVNDGAHDGHYNHLVFEVACRDNLISGNQIGPIRHPGTAGIDFTFFSFSNRIVNNRLWGCQEDLKKGSATLGIRTLANGIVGSHPGNQIAGNRLSDLSQAIGDSHPSSVIVGNLIVNSEPSPRSVGINCGSGVRNTPELANSFVNTAAPIRSNSGTQAGFGLFGGTTAPPDFAGTGSLYLQQDGAAGSTLWRRERIGPTLQWIPASTLTPVDHAHLPSARPGTLLYVTDGTPATSPLKGQGRGCMAIQENGVWRGI
jgi:hypothetical protein